jgi:hypothetical protein
MGSGAAARDYIPFILIQLTMKPAYQIYTHMLPSRPKGKTGLT